jgi:hypothetical protein
MQGQQRVDQLDAMRRQTQALQKALMAFIATASEPPEIAWVLQARYLCDALEFALMNASLIAEFPRERQHEQRALTAQQPHPQASTPAAAPLVESE